MNCKCIYDLLREIKKILKGLCKRHEDCAWGEIQVGKNIRTNSIRTLKKGDIKEKALGILQEIMMDFHCKSTKKIYRKGLLLVEKTIGNRVNNTHAHTQQTMEEKLQHLCVDSKVEGYSPKEKII